MDSRSKEIARHIVWLLALAALVLALLIHFTSGCCVSTCETMLAECERGLDELQQQVESMCSCGLPESDDGGCALASAATTE